MFGHVSQCTLYIAFSMYRYMFMVGISRKQLIKFQAVNKKKESVVSIPT